MTTNNVFLFPGENNPKNIKLRIFAAVVGITGTVDIAFQVPGLLATALELFAGNVSETFQKPALNAAGAELFVATANEALQVAALSGTDSEIFSATAAVAFTVAALTGGSLQVFSGSAAITFKGPAVAANSGGDTYGSDFYGYGFYGVEDVDAVGAGHHQILYLPRRHWQEAVIALYAAEAIDDDEFAALLAA